jgi:hypothetical protein
MKRILFPRGQKNGGRVFKKTSGFFMLYAILFTTIVLTIGISILDIVLKQVSFSGIDRESARAFYVADAGLECALYGDVTGSNIFSTSTPGTINCNGDSTALTVVDPLGGFPHFTFNFWLDKSDPKNVSCSEITLTREIFSGVVNRTIISALGYNTQCPGIGSATRNPLIERGLRTIY